MWLSLIQVLGKFTINKTKGYIFLAVTILSRLFHKVELEN